MYNPLAELNLGGNIALALVTTEVLDLGTHRPRAFEGGGVYALYYVGPLPLYEPYRQMNADPAGGAAHAIAPIYIGSSFAVGIRQGLQGVRDNTGKRHALANRISTHARTISRTARSGFPLDPHHFVYRALPLQQSHIGLAEAALITFFRPLWNGRGFGNHALGAGRPGHRDPQGFKVLHHDLEHPPGTAGRASAERTAQEFREHMNEQIAALKAPDPAPGIERFMSLIRSALKIPPP